eukprot:5835441-Prymnesium_polylepis.1
MIIGAIKIVIRTCWNLCHKGERFLPSSSSSSALWDRRVYEVFDGSFVTGWNSVSQTGIHVTPYHLLAAPPNLYFLEESWAGASEKYRFGGAASKW